MRVYRKTTSIVATILILLLLLPMGQMSGWAAETDSFTSIDQSRLFPNPDALTLSAYSEDSGTGGAEDHGIQWTLALNSMESEQAPSRLRLTLSPGCVLSKVVRADSGLLRLTAVLKDGTSRVLYDTEYTFSGPEPKFTSTEVACYEMELDVLTEKETIKFFTTFDSDSQTTFEGLAELQGETRAKAYERVDLPYREKIDIPVAIQWLDLESEGLPQEAMVSLTNPHTGEVFSQTGTEEVLFTRVPKYTSARDEILYEISQEPIEGYSTSVKGFTITNIKEPDSVETITGLDGTLPSEDTASEPSKPSKISENPSAKSSKGTQEVEVANGEGAGSDAAEQGEATPGSTEPTIKDDEAEESLGAEELSPEEDTTPGGSDSEETHSEEKPPVIEDSSPVEPDELRPPDLFEDGILTGLETLPDPVAPVEVGATKGAGGSGTIVGNLPNETLGSYTWEAVAATDGKSVQWTLTVTETGSRSTYNNYMEFKIPDEFDAITAGSISTEGENVYPPSNLDAPAGRHWGVYTYGSTSTTNYTLRVSFSTTVADGPNTTLEEFTLPYLPATQRYADRQYTTFGPTDKNSGGPRLPVTDVAWLSENTQPKVDNPGYVPPVTSVDFTVNKVDQEQQPLADALFSLTPKAGGEAATARSGADGKAIFTAVTPGEYTLKEIEAPSGYTAAPEQEIIVSAEKNDITVVNQLIPTSARVTAAARVLKSDGNTAPLADVIFSLANDTQTYESTPTDEKGEATFPMPIPFGEYTLSQEPPGGYYPAPAQSVVISEESHHFTMQSTEESLLGSLRIKIRDLEDPEKPVEGAVIRLTHKDTQQIYERTTDDKGEILLEDLPVGTYEVAQISAPAGYIAYTDSVEVTLASGQQGELTLTNLQSENTSGLGRLIVYSNVSPEFGGGRIAGAEYEVEDNFGEKWTGTTNANGELIFTGLPVTGRTYQLRQISVPYEYNTLSNPVVQKGITFAPVEFTTTVNVYNDKRDTRDLVIYVHETGDSLIPIVGAEIKVVRTFDGAEFFGTTGEDGRVVFTLLTGDYTFSQLTSDADHIKSEDITSIHLMRYYERLIPNDLIDPTSATRTITVEKVWGDPPPENLTTLNFTLQSADGTIAETKAMEVDSEGGTLTFEDVPKYTATHFKHDYTVVEEEVPEGYYAVYQRTGSDDSAWKVTNYQGVSTGTCTTGTIWVSANDLAIEINADGTRTGKEINLKPPGATFGAGSDIAITPDAKYLFGVKYYNNRPSTDKPLVIFDVATGAKLKELNLANLGWLGGANYDRVHALHIDGDNIYVKRWKSTEISVYSLQEALAAADGSTLPRKTVITGSKTSAGDIITLDNGDILFSGLTEASVGTGLWIHKKKDDGTYEAAKNVGSVTSVTGYNANGKIEGLAYYDVTGDGVPEVVITMTSTSGPTSKNSAVAYLTPTPSYNNNSTTQYMPEIFTARDFPYLEGATATRGTGCSATVQIAGSKTWVNDTPENRPTKIRVALYRNEEAAGVKDVGPDENWSWVFKDLPKFDANGAAYRYSTKEVGYFINEDYFEGPPPGYTVTGPPEGSANDFNITNTFASTSLKLTKEWVGNLPENPVPIAFYLERRPTGASEDTPWEKVPNSDIEIFSSDPDQTHTWENLPSGYDYRIVEATDLPGYVGSSPVATEDDPNHFIITNTKYEYPATGGVGTLPYMLIGLLLMAMALIIRKHKWSGGDGSREWIP